MRSGYTGSGTGNDVHYTYICIYILVAFLPIRKEDNKQQARRKTDVLSSSSQTNNI